MNTSSAGFFTSSCVHNNGWTDTPKCRFEAHLLFIGIAGVTKIAGPLIFGMEQMEHPLFMRVSSVP